MEKIKGSLLFSKTNDESQGVFFLLLPLKTFMWSALTRCRDLLKSVGSGRMFLQECLKVGFIVDLEKTGDEQNLAAVIIITHEEAI